MLGATGPGVDKSAHPVCRFELRRPDGSLVQRDWEQKSFTVRANQAGVWTWRMYIREESKTSVESGRFAVVLGHDNPVRTDSLLDRVRGWVTRR